MEKNIVVQNVDLSINKESGGVFNELYINDHWMYHCNYWYRCFDKSLFFPFNKFTWQSFNNKISINHPYWIYYYHCKYHIKFDIIYEEKI